MTIADAQWTPVTKDQAVHAWLCAERHSHPTKPHVEQRLVQIGIPPALWSAGLSKLLENPDFNDPGETEARRWLLDRIRDLNVAALPGDTQWFRVDCLKHEHLDQLHVGAHFGRAAPPLGNELLALARIKQFPLTTDPAQWDPPILFGPLREGPFAIIEGNHRLLAWANSERAEAETPVFIGLSPMRCTLNPLDL
jgi:hypothetical protein